jgi:hypothetical protein
MAGAGPALSPGDDDAGHSVGLTLTEASFEVRQPGPRQTA